MAASFEQAARGLLDQHPTDTERKFPELVQWRAAVDEARNQPRLRAAVRS
jgi:glucose-6-phosphate dehydrogenase assembly protein OpcA